MSDAIDLAQNRLTMGASDMTQATTPRRAAMRLNDHHAKTATGFYASTGGRFAGARVRSNQLEVLEVSSGNWQQANLATTNFRDHNGRQIFL